jgi:CubicO group peptidase (beta-lactamase class C family)
VHGITRRRLLRAGAAAFAAGAMRLPAIAGTEWTTIAPADAGFAPDIAARLEQLVSSGRAWNLHGVVVARAGRIVLERYFAGADETWGAKLGNVAFGPATLHDMRSVTKSIVALVYGIALADGKVPEPDAPLMAAFPEYADLARAGRERPTIGHALTMTLGTNWNEEIPYTDPANSEIAMEMAADRYRFILEREVVMEPGVKWTYSGGATALLGRLIAKGTGMALPDFAHRALFEPLGIAEIGWARGLDGEASAASGLRLTPRDLAASAS